MEPKVFTPETLEPAAEPTLYFIGVTTGASSIQRTFPVWARELGLAARLAGLDLPLHAPAQQYRDVVGFIRDDPNSVGALVTTHKIDLYPAAHDLFNRRDPLSELMGEVSSISKRGAEVWCHAKDPISAGLALDAIVPPGHWEAWPGAEACCLGAGGSAIAIAWYLSRPERGVDRPSRIVVNNRSRARLEALARLWKEMATDTPLELNWCPSPDRNDAVLAAAAPGTLVVNASGLGKDAPGSPITWDAAFPAGGVAWDLNYRGELVFLDQARAQAAERGMTVEDGWTYFLHGWTQVIQEVFHIEIPPSGPKFDALSALAVR
jgi:shikimate 5-dehydrogenase